jgi:cell division protein FtsI/penicillin-binding protein 2
MTYKIMKTRVWAILLLVMILSGCAQPTPQATSTSTATAAPTATLADVQIQTTSVPDARQAASAYLDAWKMEDYAAMYSMLTQISKDAISEEAFTTRYQHVAIEAALSGWDYEILSSLVYPQSAQIGYRVSLHSILVGDIQSDTAMNLSLEDGAWKVQWDDALIMKELGGGNTLRMEYRIPARANIYARDGEALVAQADAVAIGLDTGKVSEDTQKSLLGVIATKCFIGTAGMGDLIDAYRPYGYYLPVGDISVDALPQCESALSNYSGVILSPFRTRYYFGEGLAAHVVGYMSLIQEDEVDTYKRMGYRIDERVGRDGLEYYYEPYLAGKRGGVLYLVDKDNNIVTTLAETDSQPARSIYTTIEYDLQKQLQDKKALSDGMKGAIVVLNLETGEVLAMVSAPGFNPNLFEPANYNYQFLLSEVYNPETNPLYNRATMGQYPLGSVFKIITISAALEKGGYTTESEYNCGYFFEDLEGYRPHDWTYDHYLKDGKTQPSGLLTLPEGLMRSCNPWFWHIGLDLYNRGMITAISDMARGFGLGSPTGIEIGENGGQIPDPISQVDAINLAIGQGGTLVTPLQVADFLAAVANGGTLYRPSVIEKIVPVDGSDPVFQFTPQVRGLLPISPENLKIVQDAMYSVVNNRRGTAYYALAGIRNQITIYGKTGTAESGSGDPHAWFAGYTDANRDGKPDIAVVVLVENGGEGSEVAAPIFQRVLEIYFHGSPQTLYPWEVEFGSVRTPTPEATETPQPEGTETPNP